MECLRKLVDDNPALKPLSWSDAVARHPKPPGREKFAVPPVLTHKNRKPSIFVNDKSVYQDSFADGTLKYQTSKNKFYARQLEALARAGTEVELIAYVNRRYYTAPAKIERASGTEAFFHVRLLA